MNRRTILALVGLAIADLFLSLWIGQQSYSWMPPQASAESQLVDDLFSFLTILGSFIFFGVVGTLLYSMIFQQATKYDPSDGPPIEGNLRLEIVWTAIPIVLVIWIAAVSYQTYDQMSILGPMEPTAMRAPTAAAKSLTRTDSVDAQPGQSTTAQSGTTEISTTQPSIPPAPIKVYSRQWAWEFHYADPAISSTELHLPVNQRARLKLSSEDVLHGFYVPAFRVKQDIVPGREINFEFTPIREGRYRLRDSEYSGTYFAANQTYVVVDSAQAYQQWLRAAATHSPEPAENIAYEEFNRASQNPVNLGWETVKPAPSPIVNYAEHYAQSGKEFHE